MSESTAPQPQRLNDLSELNSQRFTPRPPSLILNLGWISFLVGIVVVLITSDYGLISVVLFGVAITISMIALFQRRILEGATLLVVTVFIPLLLCLIISGWRPIQSEYGLSNSALARTDLVAP